MLKDKLVAKTKHRSSPPPSISLRGISKDNILSSQSFVCFFVHMFVCVSLVYTGL